MAKAKLMNVDDNDEASHHSHDDSQSTFASKNKQPTKSFFDELIQDCMVSTSTCTSNDTESLIDEYLSTPCLQQEEDPLVYWKTNKEKFPCIAEIVAHYLSNLHHQHQFNSNLVLLVKFLGLRDANSKMKHLKC